MESDAKLGLLSRLPTTDLYLAASDSLISMPETRLVFALFTLFVLLFAVPSNAVS